MLMNNINGKRQTLQNVYVENIEFIHFNVRRTLLTLVHVVKLPYVPTPFKLLYLYIFKMFSNQLDFIIYKLFQSKLKLTIEVLLYNM